MDLNLLRHLSDEALKKEARARGLATVGRTREELISAIRASEDDGAVGKARALFGRVARFAKAAIERTPSQPPPAMPSPPAPVPTPVAQPSDDVPGATDARATDTSATDASATNASATDTSATDTSATDTSATDTSATDAPEATEPLRSNQREPIATLTMANVLVGQGHLERAETILAKLDAADPDVAAALTDLQRKRAEQRAELQRAELQRRLQTQLDATPGVAVAHEAELAATAWHIDDEALERGRAVLGEAGELHLRVVSVVVCDEHRVQTRHEDHPVAARGQLDFESNAARLVVSVGLRAGTRFVSLAHTRG